MKLSDTERDQLRRVCSDVAGLWQAGIAPAERQQIARLLLDRVDVEVHDNTERVRVRLHWSGGFESVSEITRPVQQFHQSESYGPLMDRVLELTLSGKRATEVASILEREGYHSPRSDRPISSMMVKKLLQEDARCRQQLTAPPLNEDHWRSKELASELGIPEKRLKDWVTRGWATAIQRPFGRVWVIYADERELKRLQALARRQSGQGSSKPPKALRTPAGLPRKKQ